MTYQCIHKNRPIFFRRGQLGNGEMTTVENPEPVPDLQGLFIIDIACGGWHCSGNLFQ